MTKAKGKQQETSEEVRCDAKDDEDRQCLYVVHDDSIEHAFTTEQAEAAGAAETSPEPTGATETPVGTDSGADAPGADLEPAEAPGPQPDPAEVAAAAAAVPHGRARKPSRVSTNSWWCAKCDTASPHETKVCPKCGTPRAGDLDPETDED